MAYSPIAVMMTKKVIGCLEYVTSNTLKMLKTV